ncbi:hypothetical protein BXZ70DRAFT_1079194 [Cristinia sonorae]|uniref:Uncharacterized protein n=1 Tax=Cristinia sonorae TaxID=1940300 RepID=A0A8K0UIP1_9AGAR|nr:hypothetical protein BXZ70DRAFT_1079194 [Cristinia sonorae]
MPRGEGEGGYIIKTSIYLVRQQGHSPSYQQAPTDSPQLQPKNLKESDRRPAEKAQRPEEQLQQLEEGIPHCRKGGGEVSINWMMRKGKVLSRAVKRKYKEKKQDRNSVK